MGHKTIKKGVCECICEPRGDYGLEGYCLKQRYFYEHIQGPRLDYLRIFQQSIDYPDISVLDTAYDVLKPRFFRRYFRAKEKKGEDPMTVTRLIDRLCDGNRNDPARLFWTVDMIQKIEGVIFMPKRLQRERGREI